MAFVRLIGSAIAFVLLVGALVATSACGSSSATCNADNCAGCCNVNTCIAKTDENACGSGGDACSPCGANEVCTHGSCVAAGMDCDGCFDPNTKNCKPGNTDFDCGVGGILCAQCTGGNTCQQGKCVMSTCTGCMSGGSCVAGTSTTACGLGGAACMGCTGSQICNDHKCVAPATCNSTNCAGGCCDKNDMCQMPGDTAAACGMGGASCEVCSGTATCVNHACKAPCGADCVGCCDAAGKCQASLNVTCGIGGAMCKQCTAGAICSGGSCISSTCSGSCPGCCDTASPSMCQLGNTNAQCGKAAGGIAPVCGMCVSPTTCVNNACHVDPMSKWDLVVVSGDVPTANRSGQPWDGMISSNPDPMVFVQLDYNGPNVKYGVSASIEDSFYAPWNQTLHSGVTAQLLLQTNNWMEVFDDDYPDITFDNVIGAEDESMGYCPLGITEAMFNGAVQEKVCTTGPATNLTWKVRFKLIPHP